MSSYIDLSRPPISCVITADEPLPASAWEHVIELTEAIERAAKHLAHPNEVEA